MAWRLLLSHRVMHIESYEAMQTFEREHASKSKEKKVIDIGSLDVNGSFRNIFDGYEYLGLDILKGKNVDIVSESPYEYPIDDESFDIVISGNTMEHVKAIWRWVIELKRILKRGGLLCITTPHSLPEHRYPVDCWRVLPDGMRALLQGHAGLDILEVRKTKIDTVGIAKK